MSKYVYRVIGAAEPDDISDQKHIFYAAYMELADYPNAKPITVCGLPFPYRQTVASFKNHGSWDMLILTDRERVSIQSALDAIKAVAGQWYAIEATWHDDALAVDLPLLIHPTPDGLWIGNPPMIFT